MRKEVGIAIKSKETGSKLKSVRIAMGLNLVDMLENALFVHAFGYMFELTVTGWCIKAIHSYF